VIVLQLLAEQYFTVTLQTQKNMLTLIFVAFAEKGLNMTVDHLDQ